jgi:diacylglycerol kinase family enzyme
MNMRAGAVYAAPGQEQLRRMARDVGLEAEVIPTHSPAEMSRVLKRLIAEGAEKVGVAGGDGTVEGAAQELAHSKTALGILPQGTFNNFAAALHVPHNLPGALRMLHDGVVREVDLGKVGSRYFTESAGVGLFADGLALYGAGANKNPLRGLYALLRLLLGFRAGAFRLVIDGTAHQQRAILCEVANTYRIAQAVPIAPEASVTDGELDVVTIGGIKARELLPYLRALRAQMHLDLPKVTSLRAREVRIEAGRRRNVHCDDRIIGQTPVTLSVQPGALKVLVDQRL